MEVITGECFALPHVICLHGPLACWMRGQQEMGNHAMLSGKHFLLALAEGLWWQPTTLEKSLLLF